MPVRNMFCGEQCLSPWSVLASLEDRPALLCMKHADPCTCVCVTWGGAALKIKAPEGRTHNYSRSGSLQNFVLIIIYVLIIVVICCKLYFGVRHQCLVKLFSPVRETILIQHFNYSLIIFQRLPNCN